MLYNIVLVSTVLNNNTSMDKEDVVYIHSAILLSCKKEWNRDFPGGSVVEDPAYNAGDVGSIPGEGTKIPPAVGQLSPRATTTELACGKLQSPRALELANHNYRENPRAATKRSCMPQRRSHMPQQRSRMPQLRSVAAKNK